MNKNVKKRLAMIKVMEEQIKLVCDYISYDCDAVMECEDLYMIEAFFERIERFASEGADYTRDTYDDPFIESMIQEVENLPSELGTLTFLVSMPLFDLFKCLNIKAKEYDKKFHYEPQLNENAKSYIVLDKKTECGLFNSWDGGGSCLEIELDKDVELPLKYCKFAVDGCRMQGRWDVNEVYGLIDSCWKETLKEIKEVG